jgi:hypothetical protein
MSGKAKFVIVFALGVLLIGAGSCGTLVNLNNREVNLRIAVERCQDNLRNEYDATWKKSRQTAGVTEKYGDDFRAMYEQIGKQGSSGVGGFINVLHADNPNLPPDTYTKLQTVIEASLDRYAREQKTLQDKKGQHDIILREFPGNILFSLLGRKEIEIHIVTSTRTEDAFRTGLDDDVTLFSSQKK